MPLPKAKTDEGQLQALQTWLSSYNPHELFHIKSDAPANEDWHPVDGVLSVIPEENSKKLGQRKEAHVGYQALNVPQWLAMGVKKGTQASCMKEVGNMLKEVVQTSVLPTLQDVPLTQLRH